jgi:hypothetical protein
MVKLAHYYHSKMKTFFLFIMLAFTVTAHAAAPADTVKLLVEGTNAYYQKVVKADSIPEGLIFNRALEFLAAKNYQQNFGDEQEGKLIFNTTQDLNVNPVYVGDDSDEVDPYTVQFAITIDTKNKRYRYTINNIVIYFPTQSGNKRQTMYDMYLKATNTQSKHIARDAKKLISSFESYITSLTNELYKAIKPQSMLYDKSF